MFLEQVFFFFNLNPQFSHVLNGNNRVVGLIKWDNACQILRIIPVKPYLNK